jgi:hypothetical protein
MTACDMTRAKVYQNAWLYHLIRPFLKRVIKKALDWIAIRVL